MEKATEMQETEKRASWKPQVLMIGGVLGALVGLGGAYLLIQSYERKGQQVSISAGEGVKLSLWIMGLLRQIATLGEGDK